MWDLDLVVVGRTPEAWTVANAARRCGQRVLIACGDTPTFADDWQPADLLHRARTLVTDGRSASTNLTETLAEAAHELQREHESRISRWQRDGGVCVEQVGEFSAGAEGVRLTLHDSDQTWFARQLWVATAASGQRPAWARYDGRFVRTALEISRLTALPSSSIVVGAGSTGLATARFLAACGSRVLLVDRATTPGESVSGGESWESRLLREGIAWMPAAEVISVTPADGEGARVQLISGETLGAQVAWVTTERQGGLEEWGLGPIDLARDERGRVWCDSQLQTSHPAVRVAGPLAALHVGLASDPGYLRQRVWEEARGTAWLPATDRSPATAEPIPLR